MQFQTIRRNSLAKIRSILAKAVLIKDYQDDGQDATAQKVTIDSVMALAPRFKNVYTDDRGVLVISLGGNYTITAYPSVAVAKHALTAQAFAKYFPNVAAEIIGGNA